MRSWSARVSLLGRFTAMGVVVVVALGLAMGTVLKQQIERRALHHAVEQARVIANLGVEPSLDRGDLRFPIPLTRLTQLDREVGKRYFDETGVLRVKLFNRDRRLVYSDDRAIIGTYAIKGGNVETALGGDSVQELETGYKHDGTGPRTLEVYVPLRVGGGRQVDGVLEVYMSYATAADEIREDVFLIALLLGGGLLILFATLFRIVAGASRRLRHQALHDALTGLPNRRLLHRRAGRALRGDEDSAMLLIDLDRFKEVNDTLGHDHGDELLVEVAGRLQDTLRRGDTLARLGGDEFAVLLDRLPNPEAAVELAGRLRDALRRPFALRGVSLELDASIGVALSPQHGDTVGTLLQRADVAMYDAKRGGHGIAVYSAERDPYSAGRLGLLAELRRAIAGGELVLHYQPKLALDSGAVTGVEALVRWQHPLRGLLAPDQFIPLAERTGTIADLTRWVIDAALAQHRAWREEGLDVPVVVNLAAANVTDGAMPDTIAALLERHGVAGDRLECEISEHTVTADPLRATAVLDRLRALGVRLSLDTAEACHLSRPLPATELTAWLQAESVSLRGPARKPRPSSVSS